MKIIDAHIHLSHIQSFKQYAKHHSHVDYSLRGLKKEMKNNHIVLAIGMGLREIEGGGGFPDIKPATPMGLDMLADRSNNIFCSVGINPYQLGTHELHQLEKALLTSNVVGMKIYLGDYPFYANDSVYEPIYDLAKAYQIPIILHTGQTYSKNGLLKFSHPLAIDELATKHKEVIFIMTQIGFPWIIDAASVMMKNDNVFAIVSNLAFGNKENIRERMSMKAYMDYLKQGIALFDSHNKVMFGSNWPYVPLDSYISFVKELFPVSVWDNVFYRTAINTFPKLKGSIRELL